MWWLHGVIKRIVLSVVLAEGERPVPSRTRKLSPPAPMVLHSTGCGRVGHRRHQTHKRGGPPRWAPSCFLWSGERAVVPFSVCRRKGCVVGRRQAPIGGAYPCVVSMADGSGREDARRADGGSDQNRSAAGDHERAGQSGDRTGGERSGGTPGGDTRGSGSRGGGSWSRGGSPGGRADRPPWRDRNDDPRGGARSDRGGRPGGDRGGSQASGGYDRRTDGSRSTWNREGD